MASIPTPLRAALGLVANAIDGARTLPSKAVDLPVIFVSTALQVSLRAQQRYAELAMRGDEVLGLLHSPPEEPPSWATFDDEQSGTPVTAEAEPVTAEAEPAVAEAEPALTTPAGQAAGEPVGKNGPKRSTTSSRGRTTRSATAKATMKPTAKATTKPTGKATAKRTGKAVRAPRQAAPSAFDTADNDLPDGAVPATQLPAPSSTPED